MVVEKKKRSEWLVAIERLAAKQDLERRNEKKSRRDGKELLSYEEGGKKEINSPH